MVSTVMTIDVISPDRAIDHTGTTSESSASILARVEWATIEPVAVPLRAEDHPVLAEIWGGDEDDDIFADKPAV